MLIFPESACEGFFVKKHLRNHTSSTSAHPHLCTITFSPISLLIFTSAHLHLCSSSHPRIYISAHLHLRTSTSLLIFTSAHLHLCSSSHPRIYISAHLHLHTSTSLLMFTSAHLHLDLCSSSHPHIYISHLHLLLFLTFSLKAGGSAAGLPRNATLCGDRACRVCETQARVRFVPLAGNPLWRSRLSDARNAGESAICPGRGQPSAEILRVGRAKCRRECDLSRSVATLCGDRACRTREMQARVRFVPVRDNPLRRPCVSSVRNAGESAICPGRGQPSAEILRVGRAKCRRECDLSRSVATLCGDRACRMREMQARVRFVPVRANPLRRSRVSSARNAGESAICPGPAQPSAEIAHVECAKCR